MTDTASATTPDGADVGLTTERRGEGLLLRLDRPTRRNALTVGLVQALATAVEGASADGVRAIVLTGSPPAFCAGGDLPELAGIAAQGALAVADVIYGNFHRLVRALTRSPLPVIAAVNGPAMGAGLDLAMSCDLRLASQTASFASSWVTVGLVPGMGGAHLLPRLVGSGRAAEALLLGTPIDPERALAWGLVNEVLPGDELLNRADELVAAIAALPSSAVSRTKAALRRSLDVGLEAELATMGATQGTLLTGPDFQRAAARFMR